MKRLALFFCTFMIYAGSVAAQGKMSPYVWQLARQAQHAPSATPSLTTHHPSPTTHHPSVCAFVKITGADAESLLRRHDSQLLARQGDVCIAMIPKCQLQALAAQPAVQRIEASRSGRLTMDTTRLVVNALPVYEGTALPQAYDGTGVVMGLMDVGFDLTHPTFLNDDGTQNRISRFWDMLSPDTVGSPMPVGRDYGRPSAAQPLAVGRSADAHLISHGTHTLGIAAGTGFGTAYRGMAPASDICLVNNAVTTDTVLIAPDDLDKYTSATDALGFKFIFDYADSLGLPCVISFSEGFYNTFIDDDRLFDEFIDTLLGPGHVLVTSAGNESGFLNYLHKPQGQPSAGAFLNTGQTQFAPALRSRDDFRFNYILYGADDGQPVDSIGFRARAVCGADSAYWAEDSAYCDSLMLGDITYRLTVLKYPSAYNPLDTIYYPLLESTLPLNARHRVAAVLSGKEADVEAWGNSGSPFYNSGAWADARVSGNILKPGTMGRVITVGNTEHRHGVVNYQGNYVPFETSAFTGGISRYSSVGPTPDGLIKPDVCAPGMNVVSSYSSYYLEDSPSAGNMATNVALFDYEGRTYAWNAQSGTSMSAPVVGGAVALWLQAKSTLSPEDVQDVLAHTCRQPDASLGYPNNTYGHGEIDVYRGLLYLLGITAISDVSTALPATVSIRPVGALALHLQFGRQPQHQLRLRVFGLSGQLLADQWLWPASTDLTVPLPPLPAGVYAVQLDGQDDGVTGSALVRF